MASNYCGSQISEHIIRDNAGFLICTAPICRSGWQEYRMSELDSAGGDDRLVRVYRSPEEVTSAATIASGEGKPVVGVGHPGQFLSPDSWSWSAKGHSQNVRIGPPDKDGNVQLFADLHIQEQGLIDRVNSGTRDLSCGYHYELCDGPELGTYSMRKIRINHIAVVPEGRAQTARIIDAVPPTVEDFEAMMRRHHRVNPGEVKPATRKAEDHKSNTDWYTVHDGGPKPPFSSEDEIKEPMKTKDEDTEESTHQLLQRLCALVEKLMAAKSATDEEKPDTLGADVIPVAYAGEGNTNPVATEDARRALDSLRQLRPAIEASGNRAAVDSYNKAVKAIKARIAWGVTVPTQRATRTAYDAGSDDYEATMKSLLRQPIIVSNGPLRPAKSTERRAEDQKREGESYEEIIGRARRHALAGK